MNKLITKLLVGVLFVLATSGGALGQSTANYAFSTNTTGSLALDANGNAIDMTTGTTALVAAGQDSYTSAVTNIGFNFIFMGSTYAQFNASSNGVMQLGTTLVSTTTYVGSGGTLTAPKLAPLACDAITASTGDGGGVTSKLIGTAPNRCLVIQWVEYLYWGNTSLPATFQARLYETTGAVEYVYGSMPVGATGSTGPTGNTGIAGLSAATELSIVGITGGDIIYSYNGIDWSNLPNYTNSFFDINYEGPSTILWNGCIWMAIGAAPNSVVHSSDGIYWYPTSNAVSLLNNYTPTSLSWDGFNWLISYNGVGTSQKMIKSSNGITWSITTVISNINFNKIIYNGILWVGCRNIYGSPIFYSYDTIIWYSATYTGSLTPNIIDIAWNGLLWLAVGRKYGNSSCLYSYNGTTWYENLIFNSQFTIFKHYFVN